MNNKKIAGLLTLTSVICLTWIIVLLYQFTLLSQFSNHPVLFVVGTCIKTLPLILSCFFTILVLIGDLTGKQVKNKKWLCTVIGCLFILFAVYNITHVVYTAAQGGYAQTSVFQAATPLRSALYCGTDIAFTFILAAMAFCFFVMAFAPIKLKTFSQILLAVSLGIYIVTYIFYAFAALEPIGNALPTAAFIFLIPVPVVALYLRNSILGLAKSYNAS